MSDQTARAIPYVSSLIGSNEQLRIQTTGVAYQRISWQIHDDLQLTFLLDATKSAEELLTIEDIDDLRLIKLSHRCSLNDQQWIDIRNFFHELIQQAKSANSLDLIVQLLQERLADMDRRSDRLKQNQTFRMSDRIQRHGGAIYAAPLMMGCADHSEHIRTDPQEKSSLAEGLYRFDRSMNQWILCSCVSITTDDETELSMEEMRLPQQPQIVTWHLPSDQPHSQIFQLLESDLPDLICLQGVTGPCFDRLLDEGWVKQNNYYLITTLRVLDRQENESVGQVMLMKNFRPRAFSISPLYALDESPEAQKLIIARFGLTSPVTIDLVSLHLPDKESLVTNEQRRRALEYLFKTMQQRNYLLIGDFSFGDADVEEFSLMERYQYQIDDLWKEIYDLEKNPGLTYNPTGTNGARTTSDSQACARRSDRFLLHTLYNLTYSIEHLNTINPAAVATYDPPSSQPYHHALQMLVHFRSRSRSYRSALAIVLSREMESHFGSSPHSIPHLKLLWPFFPLDDINGEDGDDQAEKILLPLRLLLTQYESFDLEINTSVEHRVDPPNFCPSPCSQLKELQEKIQQPFLPYLLHTPQTSQSATMDVSFNQSDRNSRFSSSPTASTSVRFPVHFISLLHRADDDDTTPFHVLYQLPLGSMLPPIGLNSSNGIHSELEEFFHLLNLYPSRSSYEQKRNKFDRLSSSFAQIFNSDTLRRFTAALLPYGSYRLGLNGDDLDTVFVLSEQSTTDTKTSLDQTLLRFRYDQPAFSAHVSSLLEKQIDKDFSKEILYCRKVQALFPIISVLFHDQTRVEIFVQIKLQSMPETDYASCRLETSLLCDVHEPIHGIHDAERLIATVRFPVVFQHLLTFIRTWAQQIGLYGQVFSYLGGFSWAILCAYICHTSLSSDHSLCSKEQFFLLVKRFFSFYSQFDWLSQSVSLQLKSDRRTDDSEHTSAFLNRGTMRILCPSPPFLNSSRSTIKSTRQLLIEAFQDVSALFDTGRSHRDCLEEILSQRGRFPHRTVRSILQLRLSGQTPSELIQWTGWMKSRLARFLTECEDACRLFVQTQHTIESRGDPLERFYCIGFSDDVQVLSRYRPFHESLEHFLDQLKYCSYRTETMKLSYRFMAIDDWSLQFDQSKVTGEKQ